VLGGAMAAGERGIGLQMIAAMGAIDLQAQAGALSVQARDDVSVISANAHIDWAAAKSISLSTAGGANITIAGGNITVQCPGKIMIHAGKKTFSGPERTSYALPHLPSAAPEKTDLEFRHFTEWGEPLAGLAFKASLSDGSVRKGQLDAQGYARLADVPPGITARIEYLRDTSALKSHVDTEIDPDVFAFFDLKVTSGDSGNGGQS
jgi:type VI secretion system secreted protein VgrG